mmetsp:Transcript_1875/g.4959  ORF Transcript_1875/g.4959 Transcript_1875/m.4959 type:complete len:103 (+) Transcript_1875:4313-4621(+)
MGIEVDDLVLSVNGQTGLSNTQAAALLRDLTGPIALVVRRASWEDNSALLTSRASVTARGSISSRGSFTSRTSRGSFTSRACDSPIMSPDTSTPRSSARRLV